MIKKDKLLNSILPLISVVAILILWIVASKSVDNEFILPNLLATVKSFFFYKLGERGGCLYYSVLLVRLYFDVLG